MQVSCKVSYSVMVYIERQGVQLDPFFEKFESPVEMLKDPNGKLPIQEMEKFLVELAEYMQVKDSEAYYREVGQHNFELRAWGVLDSVLKMVESPKEIFGQPDRFLSYFLIPNPELTLETRGDNSIIFRMPAEPRAFDNVMAYLVGAVEGLPCYMGQPPAKIERVDGLHYKITWFDEQVSLFNDEEKKRLQFHPEIVQSVMQSLQDQKDSSPESHPRMTSEAFEKMVAIEVEKRMAEWLNKQKDFDESLFKIKNDFYKMYDYFTRAQQIITLISPTARTASVKEAMRRVDWDYVQTEFPNMVESACDSLVAMKDHFRMPEQKASVVSEFVQEEVDLNDLIDNVVESLDFEKRSFIVDKNWLLDKKVYVNRADMASALGEVLTNSLANSSKEAKVRITTRPVGSKIQIEISDSSSGIPADKLETIFNEEGQHNLTQTRKIIENHRGNISVSSRQGEGSTYLIELPG